MAQALDRAEGVPKGDCISLRKVKIHADDSRFSSYSRCGRLSDRDGTRHHFRFDLAVELRAARRDRTLRSRLFSAETQIHGASRRPLPFRRRAQRPLRRAASRSVDCLPLFRARAGGLARPRHRKSAFLENSAPGFAGRLGALLCHHERVLVVERSGLREKLRRVDSSAHGRFAAIQRHADMDVFPQLGRERSSFHRAVCSLHEVRSRLGTRPRGFRPSRILLKPACSRRSNATKSKCSR